MRCDSVNIAPNETDDTTPAGNESVQAVSCQADAGRRSPSPAFYVLLSQVGRPAIRVQATPDTGVTVPLLTYRIAQQQNLFINKLKCPSLVNASGLHLQVEGTATVNICANDLFCSVDAVIISDLRDDLLVRCEDLRRLKIIPANFPHQTV